MPGGAERIMTFLAKNIGPDHFETQLLVLGSNSNTAYNIDGVNAEFLNKNRVLSSIPSLILHIKKVKPDVVMSSIDHLNVIMGAISVLFSHTIFIGRQASVSKVSANFQAKKTNKLFSVLRKWALRKLDYLVCQSHDMYVDCEKHYSIKKDKLTIIHNPITENFCVKDNLEFDPKEEVKFITVGRLDKIKGHLRLLKVLSNINYPYKYTIIGDGPEKEEIQRLVNTLQLNQKVVFIGYTDQVQKYLKNSHYYLQGSYTEGFPNALLESCAVGTPAIAFEAPGGTSEIIEPGINGFIAPDEVEFINYLANLKIFNAQTVSNSVYNKFAKEIIVKQYETFFLKAVKPSLYENRFPN